MKLAIFDMDGTLLDSMWMWRTVLTRFLEKLQLPDYKEINDSVSQMSFTKAMQYVTDHYDVGMTADELYEALEKEMKERGYLNLYACIAYPEVEDEYLTKNSAKFHAHLGYELVGKFHKCGYKFGRWYNMIWMEKIIGEHCRSDIKVI
jgi:phosphoglycolate phosphatase-like HAD superfamily hydrolase